jgi:tetratricopeptide (TPR) repeat protein
MLVLVLAACALLPACGGFSRVRLELKSEPSGAEISTLQGEKLGSTPLTLQDQSLEKAVRDGRLMVTLSAPGYATRELLLEFHGQDSHDVKLSRLDEDYLLKKLMTDFSRQSNELARELLQIQGLLVINKLDEAEKQLEGFQKRFPNIAASYVMLGNLEAARGDLAKARAYFVRARSIDPGDPVIARLLGTAVESDRAPASQPSPSSPSQPKGPQR